MKYVWIFVICFAATFNQPSYGAVEEEVKATPARILVEKRVLNKYLVEARDIILHYQLFNVGQRYVNDARRGIEMQLTTLIDSPAIDVRVEDNNLASEHFDLMSGVSTFTIPRLAP